MKIHLWDVIKIQATLGYNLYSWSYVTNRQNVKGEANKENLINYLFGYEAKMALHKCTTY
jgi:hypothetical protein